MRRAPLVSQADRPCEWVGEALYSLLGEHPAVSTYDIFLQIITQSLQSNLYLQELPDTGVFQGASLSRCLHFAQMPALCLTNPRGFLLPVVGLRCDESKVLLQKQNQPVSPSGRPVPFTAAKYS